SVVNCPSAPGAFYAGQASAAITVTAMAPLEVPITDRTAAGRALAELLAGQGGADTLVLALPRGGVPVAYEIAEALGSPLDLMLVRKLGVPGHEELAMGAIASGGV